MWNCGRWEVAKEAQEMEYDAERVSKGVFHMLSPHSEVLRSTLELAVQQPQYL